MLDGGGGGRLRVPRRQRHVVADAQRSDARLRRGGLGRHRADHGRRRPLPGRRRRRRPGRSAGAGRDGPRARRRLPGGDRAAHRPLPARARRRVPAPAARGVARARRRRRAAAVPLAHVRRLDAAAGGEPAPRGRAARAVPRARRRARDRVRRRGRRGGRHRRRGDRRRAALHDDRGPAARRRRRSGPASAGATCSRPRSATSTALYAPGHVRLRPEILARRPGALSRARTRARASTTSSTARAASAPDELRAAVAYGVVKVNLDTEAQYAFTRAVGRPHALALRRRAARSTAASATSAPTTRAPGATRPRPGWQRESHGRASCSARPGAASSADGEDAALSAGPRLLGDQVEERARQR